MLKTPQRLTVGAGAGENAAQPIAVTLPKWISPEPLNANEQSCAEALATDLDNNKPLVIALREMANRRRVEQRAFAAQCLALLDDFEPLVSMFGDATQKPMWQGDKGEIATAKAALTRGPDTAAKVREAFQKSHGDEAGRQLYRMLLGYTKEQLQNGEAEILVSALDNDNLDYRVLAFAALQEITGGKTHLYRPDSTAAQRATPVRLWKQDQAGGTIVPKEAPAQK